MTQPTPLLLLPGLMNDARGWDTIRPALPAGRHISVAPTHLADSLEAIAASAIGLMPAGPFAVAGFSLGGYVAMEVCRQAQARVTGIALLDTGARADSDEARLGRQRMVAALGSGGATFAQVAGGFASRVVHPAHAGDGALMQLLIDMAREVGGEGFARQQTAAMNRPDNRELLAQLNMPALVVCGREDQITPLALSEEMAAILPDAELVVVEQSGHMVTLEQPAAVQAAFEQWLRRVDGSRR